MQKTTTINKEQAGFIQNPEAELSPVPALPVPWWISPGLQPAHADGYQHLSTNTSINQLGVAEESQHKSAGDKINSENGQEPQNNQVNITALSSTAHQQKGYFEIRLGQPMVSTTSSHPDQVYGLFTSYGPQNMGSVMLPMSLTTDCGTIYVNPKQYHGILRRRKSRAKAALKAKPVVRNKPYLHESRHLHAMRRTRGAGGRFLNSKEFQTRNETAGNKKMTTTTKNKTSPNDHHDHQQFSNPSRSSSSEVLQGESKGSNPSGSEVTSVLYGRRFDWFQAEHEHDRLMSMVEGEDHLECDLLKASINQK